MLRIAIVEDDVQYAKKLSGYIERYEREKGERFSVRHFSDGADIAENYKAEFDIILMDVEMRFMDGMSAAKMIRNTDPYVAIIFITNMPQYAMKGYEVEALDYVLKPINYFAFSTRLSRAVEKQTGQKQIWYTLTVKGGVRRILLSDICCVEVQDHELIYYTDKDRMTARGTLTDVEEQIKMLESDNGIRNSFFRCNKGCLVNLEHVLAVEGSDVVLPAGRFPVSRARKKSLLDAMNDFFVI